MKIGVFSGTFDPITLGHKWIVDEGLSLFDEMHVLVGSPQGKNPTFAAEERLEMARQSCGDKPIYGILKSNIVDYSANLKKPESEVYILRGVRNNRDFDYEVDVQDQTLCAAASQKVNLHTFHLIPPKRLSWISSSEAKHRCLMSNWPYVRQMVTQPVYEKLELHYGKLELARLALGIEKERRERTEEAQKSNKSKKYFDLLLNNGFVAFAEKVTGEQIRELLDTVPFDVVCSPYFELNYIDLDVAEPTGIPYLTESLSFGPIVVEKNFLPEFSKLGPNLIIEGKHRWYDAKKRGETKIWAWVGSKAGIAKG